MFGIMINFFCLFGVRSVKVMGAQRELCPERDCNTWPYQLSKYN